MKMNLFKLFSLLLVIFLITGCGRTDFADLADENMNKSFTGNSSPEGNDILSATTNHSDKAGDTAPELNPLAGASFVQAPQINNYGSVSLGYQIDVPAGRAGMQPQVSLGYSSSGGDGLVGIGWNMSTGLGSVSRTTSNGELYYDYRDTFTYNGQRLIKVSGPSNSENGVYRQEIESGFNLIELTDAENGGVWTVRDKSGRVTIFGEERSERIYQPANNKKTYLWNFSRSYDLNGNEMYALYDSDSYANNHILYLKEIRYTGNRNEDFDARQYVRFHYEDRDDAYVSKAPGFIMKMDQMLDYIEVGWDNPSGLLGKNTELWRYTMVYEESADSHRPLLKTVESTRHSTQPEFKYQPAEQYFVWKNVHNPAYNDPEVNPADTQYFEGDFNGDGLSDMVFFNPQTGFWKAAEARRDGGYNFVTYGEKFAGAKIQWFKGNVTGDYNGDGRSDIAFYLPESREFWVAEHNGKVFTFKCYGRLTVTDVDIFACEWFSGDYDGNGLSDAVLFNEPTGEWILMTNMGGRFEFVKFAQHFQNVFRDDYVPDGNLDSSDTSDYTAAGHDRDKVFFFNGDYNGDGRSDIAVYDSRDGRWWIGENYRDNYLGFKFQWRLYQQFTVAEQALFANDRFSGDFNGDGFSDFMLFDRSTGEWIIGETGDGVINFRKWSRAPQFKEITRWLQGDFNGDGRTDVGFFSATDNKFWIGEATPDGFRYRIYNDLSYGPDASRVLAKAPLPEREVILGDGVFPLVNGAEIKQVNYQYNSNYHANGGEQVFTGRFVQSDNPQLLIYNRQLQSFYFKNYNADIQGPYKELSFNLNNITLLNNGEPLRNDTVDAIFYHEKIKSSISGDSHNFRVIEYNNGISATSLASFKQSDIPEFTIDRSQYLLDSFTTNKKQLLVYNFVRSNPTDSKFRLYNGSTPTDYTFALANGTAEETNRLLSVLSAKTSSLLFSGKFDGATTTLLLADVASKIWYKGTLDHNGKIITFTRLTGTPTPSVNGLVPQYHVYNGGVIYYQMSSGALTFHRLTINNGTISETNRIEIEAAYTFKGQYDSSNNPVLIKNDGTLARLEFGTSGQQVKAITDAAKLTITRPDLIGTLYPFQWIQGDYNGDNKTDIGIFHLKESCWYFAMTQGTVPDMMSEMSNGIGGRYFFEYINSTTLDNNGSDGIPHLPMNYKVCNRLSVDDGFGHRVTSKYEYKGGYAFSAFINGKKETDYFGFTEFKVIDPLGGVNLSVYNNIAYDDFRKNRALAGAIKESRFTGGDGVEYSRSNYVYTLHEIKASGASSTSFLIEPTKIDKYVRDRLSQTQEATIELAPGKYEMLSRTEKLTDHYTDSVHPVSVSTNYTLFESVSATNETRPRYERKLVGTAEETRVDYTYDICGNLIYQTTSYSGSGLQAAQNLSMHYLYDNFGNRIREENLSDTPSRIVEREFDAALQQYVAVERNILDGYSLETRVVTNYEGAFGSPAKKIDPNGNASYFDYDSKGRLVAQRLDTDSGVETINSYTYDTRFPLSARVEQHADSSKVIKTAVYKDGFGRMLHSVRSATEASGRHFIKSGVIIYDALGRVIRQSQPDWGSDDDYLNYHSNAYEKNATITEYDASGRVKKQQLPEVSGEDKKAEITYTYNDPWEVVETHSAGRSKRTIKNSRGEILYVEDFGRGDDGQEVHAKIGFAYDAAGRRIKKMDLNNTAMTLNVDSALFAPGQKDTSGNNVALWRYDGLGRLVATSDPDQGFTSSQYNGFGQAVSITDALNRTTTMSYDRAGRMVQKNLPNGEGSVTYIYDQAYNGLGITTANTLGRLVAILDPASNKAMTYDKAGRVTREARQINSVNEIFVTDFEYDLLGRQTKISYPVDPRSQRRLVATYNFNSLGVASIRSDIGDGVRDVISSIDYNELGQQSEVIRGNGVKTTYQYDSRGRLTNMLSTILQDGRIKTLQNVNYTFKSDNSIKRLQSLSDDDGIRSATYDYSYDGINRLLTAGGRFVSPDTAATQDYAEKYSYAQNGNMLSRERYTAVGGDLVERLSYTYANHQATHVDSTANGADYYSQEYDAAGNMTHQLDRKHNLNKFISYDSSNRISKVTDASNNTVGQYEYDDQGFRIRKVSQTPIQNEIRLIELLYPSMYFGIEKQRALDGTLIENTDYSVNNIYLNGLRIAAVIPTGKTLYFMTDNVDSVKLVTDDDGKAVSRYEYKPFGETLVEEGDKSLSPKYNSQELDKETQFYFYNARYYDPGLCRFVTADNVIDGDYDTQGWNRYSYVKNGPVNYKDPSGNTGTVGFFSIFMGQGPLDPDVACINGDWVEYDESDSTWKERQSFNSNAAYQEQTLEDLVSAIVPGGGTITDRIQKKANKNRVCNPTNDKKIKSKPRSYKNLKKRSAEDVNKEFIEKNKKKNPNKKYNPPYKKGTDVYEYEIGQEEKFVRVYNGTEPGGSWMMKESEIKGLTPDQIQKKYSLPSVPTNICDVKVPAGTKIRQGIVEANYGGNSGATQFELIDRLTKDNYINRRKL